MSLRDDELCNIIRKGDVTISLSNGLTLKLKDIKNVLKLKRNLISVGQLADVGMKATFDGDLCKITKCAMIKIHIEKEGILHIMSGSITSISVASSNVDTST